jgi:hypothetical protein
MLLLGAADISSSVLTRSAAALSCPPSPPLPQNGQLGHGNTGDLLAPRLVEELKVRPCQPANRQPLFSDQVYCSVIRYICHTIIHANNTTLAAVHLDFLSFRVHQRSRRNMGGSMAEFVRHANHNNCVQTSR